MRRLFLTASAPFLALGLLLVLGVLIAIDLFRAMRDNVATLRNAPTPAERAWYARLAGDEQEVRRAEADAAAVERLLEELRVQSKA